MWHKIFQIIVAYWETLERIRAIVVQLRRKIRTDLRKRAELETEKTHSLRRFSQWDAYIWLTQPGFECRDGLNLIIFTSLHFFYISLSSFFSAIQLFFYSICFNQQIPQFHLNILFIFFYHKRFWWMNLNDLVWVPCLINDCVR